MPKKKKHKHKIVSVHSKTKVNCYETNSKSQIVSKIKVKETKHIVEPMIDVN